MKFSIIIPTFNSTKVLGRALDSIVCQTFEDWEVLVMDGASEDDTVSIAQSYNDNRIRIFSEPDKGIYDAMNKGIEKSKGEWLYFLGSDDYLFDSSSLESVSKELDDKYDVVYGEVDSSLPVCHRGMWTLENILANRCHQCIFYRKTFFGDKVRYNLKYQILADFDLNLRWFLGKEYSSKYVPIVVAHYSDGGLSQNSYDGAFYDDLWRNILCYGRKTLSPLYKKKYVRQWKIDSKGSAKKILLSGYLWVERALCFAEVKFFHIPQKNLRK